MSDERARWSCGIIGFGRMGSLMGRLLADERVPGLTLTAVADFQAVDWTRSPVLPDYKDLLRLPLDAVIIATPPELHYTIACDALQAGKHVFVEKPPTQTTGEAEKLGRLSGEVRKVLFFGYHAQYNSSVRRARNMLAQQSVQAVEAEFCEDVLQFHSPGSWVFKQGVLRDSGINALSILTAVLPGHDDWRVTAADFKPSGEAGADRKARIELSLGGQAKGLVLLDWEHHGKETRTLTFRTSGGTLTIDIAADRMYQNGVPLDPMPDPAPEADGFHREYQAMLRDFAASLRSGHSSCGTTEVRLVEEAYRSARTKFVQSTFR
jgi:D-galactose 1-dehydrogenase